MMKHRHLKLAVAALLAFVTVFPLLFTGAYAGDGTENIPLSKCEAYLISTPASGKVLKSENADKQIFPASTVKIMSGLLLCEQFAGRLDEHVTITEPMIKDVGASRHMGLKVGNTPTVRDLLYLGFCGGFNDAVKALAVLHYGSEEGIVAAMNIRAASLGMKDTFYANVGGIHDPSMHTTVNDLAILAAEAMKNSLFMTVSSALSYSTEGLYSPFSFPNYNSIISSGQYRNTLCRGMNAGSTPQAGNVLVTVAEKNGVSYLCIVMGAQKDDDNNYSYIIANRLISWAINRYGTKKLLSSADVICEIPVTLSVKTKSVICIPAEDVTAFLPLDYEVGKEITRTYELFADTLEAPVELGAKVGTVTVFCDGDAVATVDLVTKTAAEKNEFLGALEKIKAFSKSDVFIGTVITAAALIILWIIINAIIKGTRKKKRKNPQKLKK